MCPSHAQISNEIIRYIIRFSPEVACSLGGVSLKLARIVGSLAQPAVAGIFAHYTTGHSIVGRHIQRIQQSCMFWSLRTDSLMLTCVRIHSSIGRQLQLLGGSCSAGAILSLQEVIRCDQEIETLQNTNLRKIWNPVQKAIRCEIWGRDFPADLPDLDAPANDIRTWMHNNTPLLQRLNWLNLSKLDLTCIPLELGLCTGLQTLNLFDNRLYFLPEGLFQKLTALQFLNLSHNQLVIVPVREFQGLTGLNELGLCNNPQLLVSWQSTREEPELMLEGKLMMREFFTYQCQSPFAQFYQDVAKGVSPDALRLSFSGLPDTIKNAIYWTVWDEAGRPTGDFQWGEHHAFDDLRRFYGVLKRYVRDCFKGLPDHQKENVYSAVHALAASKTRGVNLLPNMNDYHRMGPGLSMDNVEAMGRRTDLGVNSYPVRNGCNDRERLKDWGTLYAFRNILRLIDAMEQQKS